MSMLVERPYEWWAAKAESEEECTVLAGVSGPKPALTLHGQCHRRPYSQEVADLHDAVCCAAVAIDLNLWHPEEVRDQDGKVVMGKDELWERATAI